MTPAPLLQSAPRTPGARGHGDIALIYRSWAEHYNSCETCQRDRWYDPFAGEPFFCAKGQGFFRAWVSVARVTPPRTSVYGR